MYTTARSSNKLSSMLHNTKKPFKYSTTYYRKKAVLQKKWSAINPLLLQNERRSASIDENLNNVRSSTIITTSTEIQRVEFIANDVPSQTPIICASQDFDEVPIENYEGDNVALIEDFDDADNENGENYVLTSVQQKEILRNWLITNQITHKATNELLHILTAVYRINNLPKDARTFLRTPKQTRKEIKKIGSGEYWHNGLKDSLRAALQDIVSDVATVNLSFNIDGLPIYDSARSKQ